MFRRTGPRGDAVDAARRRLAALAAQYDQPDGTAYVDAKSVGGRHAATERSRGRWLSPAHLALAALVVAAGIAVTAWWILRAVPNAEPVRLSTGLVTATPNGPPTTADAAAPQAQPGTTATTAGSAGTGTVVVVDIAGKVRRPGIVELPAGSRVVDALEAAGGARSGADLVGLNLARPLVDGEQVVVGLDVPVLGSTGSAPTSGAAPVSINLNTATADQLETLPGVGPVTAAAILQWRDEHGGFASVGELLEVSGIGPATMADIEPLVHV